MKEQLAINGGNPIRQLPYPKWPLFTQKDKDDLAAALDDGRMTSITGPKVKEFEDKYAEKFGAKYALATSNGVVALHLALAALEIGPGDEVIVPAHTFIGTAIPVVMANAIPVFVDVRLDTFNIDPLKIEAAITDRTKAIMPVHLNGLCAEMDTIAAIAKKHNLFVIEDACQAHGGKYKGKTAGTIGDIGCFSFFEDKVLTTGEGGMLITDSPQYYELARCIRSYGEGLVTSIGERKYEHVKLGFNYRMGSLNAALGINQLDRLEEMVQKRNSNAKYLIEKLSGTEGVITPKEIEYCLNAYYKFVCRIDRTKISVELDKFIEAIKAEGIPATPRYPKPLPLQKVFKDGCGYGKTDCPYGCDKYGRKPAFFDGSWPVAEQVGRDAFVLLIHPSVEEKDLDDVANAVNKVAANFIN
ncbi:MAG: DegT/DnrJ/EryC1/StrS family aminotransferase [Actinobacteria bacterium]|nr:DegT/DnrJ/EryC1/StrS family aminotransferase [Actinomycetota bacterium]